MSSTVESTGTAVEVAELPGAVPSELQQLLVAAGFRGRQLLALSARLGLAGGEPLTLADAGLATGYTRERVRQLEHRLRLDAAAGPPPAPALERALRQLERLAPSSASQGARALAAAGLVPPSFRVVGLLGIADALCLEHDLCEVGGALVRKRDVSLADESLQIARRLVRRDGVGAVDSVARELGADATTIRRLLLARPDLIWLDRAGSWFLVRGTRTRLTAAIRKMLSISGTLTFADLCDGLRRMRRPVLVPLDVLASLCALQPWLVVDRAHSTVTLKVFLDPSRTHAPVELAILSIFAEHGPELGSGEVAERGKGLGLKPMSVRAYLTRMPALEQVARGRYALRGAAVGGP